MTNLQAARALTIRSRKALLLAVIIGCYSAFFAFHDMASAAATLALLAGWQLRKSYENAEVAERILRDEKEVRR